MNGEKKENRFIYKCEATPRNLVEKVCHLMSVQNLDILFFFDDQDPFTLNPANFIPQETKRYEPRSLPSYISKEDFSRCVHLKKSVCEGDHVGFVINLAHELRHVLQFDYNPDIHRLGNILYHHLREASNEKITSVHSVPKELDADRVAKKVVQNIFRAKDVQRYIRHKIETAVEKEKKQGWVNFKEIGPAPVDSPLNGVLDETIALIRKYKAALLKIKEARKESSIFSYLKVVDLSKYCNAI